jgi:hypothetical protein
MAETSKLSVERALNKIRETEARQSANARTNDEIAAIDEDIKRMRAQRLRLERHQRRSTKQD